MKALLVLLCAAATCFAQQPVHKVEYYQSPLGTNDSQTAGLVTFTIMEERGEIAVSGPVVPMGEVWQIRSCAVMGGNDSDAVYTLGISGHSNYVPLMMQRFEKGREEVFTLAYGGGVLLIPGEAIQARCNSIRPDKQLGITGVAWVVPAMYFNNLLINYLHEK